MYISKIAASTLLASFAAVANASSLTLDDIDQLSRAKVVNDLRGASSPAVTPASASAPPVVPATPGPVSSSIARGASKATSHGTPITFVGAYRDGRGSHVLYAYDSAVYDALTGKKLLNGWVAEKVTGFAVTVRYGRETWTETIRGGSVASPVAMMNPAIQAITDLASPLPPAGFAMTGAIAPTGR